MVKKGLINVPQGFGNIFWEKIWMEIFNNFSFYIQNPTIHHTLYSDPATIFISASTRWFVSVVALQITGPIEQRWWYKEK